MIPHPLEAALAFSHPLFEHSNAGLLARHNLLARKHKPHPMLGLMIVRVAMGSTNSATMWALGADAQVDGLAAYFAWPVVVLVPGRIGIAGGTWWIRPAKNRSAHVGLLS